MIKIEDCAPGVEVICINDKPHPECLKIEYPKLGFIYTIKIVYPKNVLLGKYIFTSDAIGLNEIKEQFDGARLIGFGLYRFKLLDPKAIEVFRQLLTSPIDKELIEELTYN